MRKIAIAQEIGSSSFEYIKLGVVQFKHLFSIVRQPAELKSIAIHVAKLLMGTIFAIVLSKSEANAVLHFGIRDETEDRSGT